jgi:hypothetical protein
VLALRHGAIALGLALIVLGSAEYVGTRVLSNAALTPLVRLASVVVVAYAIYATAIGALNGARAFGRQARLDATFSVVRTLGLLGGGLALGLASSAMDGLRVRGERDGPGGRDRSALARSAERAGATPRRAPARAPPDRALPAGAEWRAPAGPRGARDRRHARGDAPRSRRARGCRGRRARCGALPRRADPLVRALPADDEHHARALSARRARERVGRWVRGA